MSRPMTLGVRGLVSDSDGRIVMVRHTYVEGWYLPGGGVERGETAADALRRELAEEAGVKLEDAPELIGVFSNHSSFPDDHVLLFSVASTGWSICETDCAGEVAEIRWVDPGDLPDGTTPGTLRRLEEWQTGAPPAAYW